MCEQTEINYLDGEVVWVKLGSCWWPGEVVGFEKLPPDVLPSFRKPPIAVVKFFLEDTYEYVKNINSIYKYNCSRKHEFISKGLYMYRTKHGHMEKFPEDIIRAENAVGGDITILTRDEFQETKKESYAGIFGDQVKRTPGSGKPGRGRPSESLKNSTPIRKFHREKNDYKVHILLQGSKTSSISELIATSNVESTPSTSSTVIETEPVPASEEEQPKEVETPVTEKNKDKEKPASTFSTPVASSSGIYACHACPFTTTRLNVLILHNKTHSVSFIPYTPSPVRKKLPTKQSKSTPNSSKTPKIRRPRKEKTEKTPKKTLPKKRLADESSDSAEAKKTKTDEEIKTSLLADWDDGDEESNDESSTIVMAGSPEVPIAPGSPAVPTPAELPATQIPRELSSPLEKKPDSSPASEKPESSSDSKYEFCEDEDWPLEADGGRKIPRVKNPKRKEETKSLSLDDEDMAREVAELLNKTTVPDLPSAPEPLKVEENFPEPSIVKSPDKKHEQSPEKHIEKSTSETVPTLTKAIFKTKTFFRSRHSRSQDAIGKYVAEQLNAVERMDISESEINGSDVVSSPEARESPPIEQVKVARLAPKIQLKKMKAEAAQLREKEKTNLDQLSEVPNLHLNQVETFDSNTVSENEDEEGIKENENDEKVSSLQDVLYPTQEIKPVTEEPDLARSLTTKENTEALKMLSADENSIENNNETDKIDEIVIEIEPNKCNPAKEMENTMEIIKYPEVTVQQSYEKVIEPLMNESTASAVDALLSVSRETDRVTRTISNDLPEDLFEDDTAASNSVNGFNENIIAEKDVSEEVELENVIHIPETENVEKIQEPDTIPHAEVIQSEVINNKNTVILPEEIVMSVNEEQVEHNETIENITENVPSESDLQIAEALINLPSTAIQIKTPIDRLDESAVPITQDPETFTETIIHIPESTIINEEKNGAMEEDVQIKSPSSKSESLLIKNTDNMNVRFETEQEKCENLNAAQSLVQMSESIDHKMNILEANAIKPNEIPDSIAFALKQNNGIDSISTVEETVALLPNESSSDSQNSKSPKFETSTSKLLKILEEPCVPKVPIIKTTPTKPVVVPGKEKILNFDVAKTSFKSNKSPKQKIIIRRTAPSKNIIHSLNEVTTPDKIILSRSNNPTQDGSAVQTFTIQTTPEAPSDANSIIIQQKIRKISKLPTKLQKVKNSLVSPIKANETKIINETPVADDGIFDINSMPIVLSEDLLTPENIEKMPVVMSDANIIAHQSNPPKLVKKHTILESEKALISASPNKPEVKTLLMNPVSETNKVTTPNILSKSSKLRGAKPMLVIDKATGKQKIIMTKAEPPVKEIKQTPSLVQSLPQNQGKGEKYIILPSPSSPRPGRTQKILIDPQTGKAHVLVAKGPEAALSTSENKPVSAKLVPSSSDASTPGNTVMIITNAQGAQSRIVLTPEHEKILFPNKQQPNVSQLKTIAHRITTNSGSSQKTGISTIPSIKTQTAAAVKSQGVASTKTISIASAKSQGIASTKTQGIMSAKAQGMASVKTPGLVSTKNQAITHTNKAPTRIVPKQKSAIITSKGQLIVGGRVTTTAQNIAPMPEIRTVPKRIVASEPKKLVQTIQKASSEPLIFLQQKSGAVMQLTAAQFEHLQRTGQIVQKTVPSIQEKVVAQKSINITSNEPVLSAASKPRIRKTVMESHTPVKKAKQEIAIAPAPASFSSMPPLTTLSNSTTTSLVPSVSNTVSITTTTNYPDLDNFEELLPSTAIVKQPEPVVPQPEPVSAAPPAPLSDGQLLAVPGEHFGGPHGSFYLCVEDNGTLTPIDNRPLVLENNQLVPMPVEQIPVLSTQPERRDILEAALANSDVFHADPPRDEVPDFRDLNANVSVHCRVSETSTTLNQPIMTPVEMPTKGDSEPAVPANLEDGLAVIGVTPHTIPTSLELPITVTDPRIALKTTDPLSNNNYGTSLLTSPSTEMSFVTTEDVPMVGPISMPLLTDDESVGKSMPILTDDVTERTVSSVESTVGSPSSLDVRESETEDGSQLWSRRLLTPGSDTSETSSEIPLQPVLQLSVNDMSHHS